MNLGLIPAKWAALEPRRTAVVDVSNAKRLTFGALDARVRRLANGLVDVAKLMPGARVAILSRNCAEFLECYYACGRVGLLAQPLNWRVVVPELARALRDGEPSLVVSSHAFRAQRDALQAMIDVPRWLEFGDDSDGSYEDFLAAAADEEPARSSSVGGDDPFVMLYTGGTTGESKNVLHSHRSFAMGMLNQTVAERIVPSDVYMLTGQMFHIPVGLAMNYMAHGCPLVLLNFDAKVALENIQNERVSAFLAITTMFQWMMAVPSFATYELRSLRNVQYGGGPMAPDVVRAALDAFPCTLIQGYGQTEGMTMTFLSQEDHRDAVRGIHPERLGSCGREAFLTTVRVVDERGYPVAKDGKTTGEIIVRSSANMLGYWRRDALTAETLRGGWLWTGDVATWDSSGYVFIVGRAKDLIISGGENIYAAQVEAAVQAHPAVLDVAVIGVPDADWGESVKAIVVRKPGEFAANVTESEIIETAKVRLASYQKPRSVEFVDALPRGPTGKVLKPELRAKYGQRRD